MEILEGSGPLYKRLTLNLQTAILNGDLKPGEKMPSSRALSQQLGISRNVIVQAYDQLIAEGYMVAKTGAGSFVTSDIPAKPVLGPGGQNQREPFIFADRMSRYAVRVSRMDLTEEDPGTSGPKFDFQYGAVVPGKASQRLFARMLRDALYRRNFAYGTPQGTAVLREQVAKYLLRHRGLAIAGKDVQIVNGSQQALDILTRAVIEPGDGVIVEEPHYPGARQVFESTGAKITACPIDEEGLVTAALPKRPGNVKMIYVTPSRQFPVGSVMSLSRRLELLDWAAANRVMVVEDDYDSEFRFETRPISPLKSLDKKGLVVYVGTFAKALFPGLRLGYMVPPPGLSEILKRIKRLSDRCSSVPLQSALAAFIEEGAYDRHIRRASRVYGTRHKTLVDALNETFADDLSISGSAGGLHVLVWFKRLTPRDIPSFIAAAREKNVGVYPVDHYYLSPPKEAGLLLGYGTIDKEDILEGVHRLGAVYRDLVNSTTA